MKHESVYVHSWIWLSLASSQKSDHGQKRDEIDRPNFNQISEINLTHTLPEERSLWPGEFTSWLLSLVFWKKRFIRLFMELEGSHSFATIRPLLSKGYLGRYFGTWVEIAIAIVVSAGSCFHEFKVACVRVQATWIHVTQRRATPTSAQLHHSPTKCMLITISWFFCTMPGKSTFPAASSVSILYMKSYDKHQI